ncbi:MAG: zf-HC2 domain-containing protein [Melioribacteraceae bacterium]|nr:zf-HC2 domain-containing protein [Melioribacteraceae bacterium]
MSCNIKNRNEIIEKYLGRELDEDEMNEFENHFLQCDECFEELQTTKSLMVYMENEDPAIIDRMKNASNPGYYSIRDSFNNLFDKLILPRPVLSFATAAVLAGVIIVSIFINDNDIRHEVISSDQIVREYGLQKYADNFVAAPDMEKFMNQKFRSGDVIEIISPENDLLADGKIIFEWKKTTDKLLTLKILDNREHTLISISPESDKFVLNPVEKNLEPGLYYWKLETADELLHLGRFFIK